MARASGDAPLYLYNFPALSGVALHPQLVTQLLTALGERRAGLKDSSNDLPYARKVASLSSALDVFPSNEVSAIKFLVAEAEGDPEFARVLPPLAALSPAQQATLKTRLGEIVRS